jgi:hypothetical protein
MATGQSRKGWRRKQFSNREITIDWGIRVHDIDAPMKIVVNDAHHGRF